jgi:predicted dehydrogenase
VVWPRCPWPRRATPKRWRQTRKRVGLIGSGWYGKADLLRLVQVAPVEVVSLCDVDKAMLQSAAELVATRQASKKTPRTYSDYRRMLAEKDLDIVLIATPDHWHALTAIAAMEAGADLYLQKPICVDVVEGQSILAAARRLKRVVQVGTQRRSTPHVVEARDRIVREGKLGKVGLVEIYCYYHMRTRENPPDTAPPPELDYEFWTGPAPLRPYNKLVHPRSWRAFMEYGNGIVGDMCIHMLDMVRFLMDLGMPRRISSTGGIVVDKNSKANITDSQTATFEFPDLQVVWTHRTWGDPPDPKYPWGATLYGEKGTLKASVMSYDFVSREKGVEPVHKDVTYELEQFPEDKTEKDLEKHVAPGDPLPHEGPARSNREARPAGRRHRTGLHVDDGLHPRQRLDAARPHARVGPQRRAAWSATTRPTSCWRARTARRGCTRGRLHDAQGRRRRDAAGAGAVRPRLAAPQEVPSRGVPFSRNRVLERGRGVLLPDEQHHRQVRQRRAGTPRSVFVFVGARFAVLLDAVRRSRVRQERARGTSAATSRLAAAPVAARRQRHVWELVAP